MLAHTEEHSETEVGHAEDAEGDIDLHVDAHGSIAEDAHGADAHHGEPHESQRAITGPLWVLTFFAVFAGFINAAPFHIENFRDWFEPRVAFPVATIVHAEFSWPKAIISVLIALLGAAIVYAYYWRELGLQNCHRAQRASRAGKTFLVKKYYLDDLYEKVIVAGIKGPIARARPTGSTRTSSTTCSTTRAGCQGARSRRRTATSTRT